MHFLQRMQAKVQDRQCTYKRNMEARSPKHCCRGKAIRVTFSVSVSVAFGIQYETCMREIAIRGLSDSTIFFPKYLINGTIFEKLSDTKCVY
jgi:hypothetical protein